MKKLIGVLMSMAVLMALFGSLTLAPVGAESAEREINLLQSRVQCIDDVGSALTRNQNGTLTTHVDLAWSGEETDIAQGVIFMPMLENVDLTGMYLHIGVTCNTPIRIVTLDMPDFDETKAFGFELVSEFVIAPVGKEPINVDAEGNFVYPDNGFMPCGTYEICVPYGELYQFYEDYDYPYVDTDNANMTAIYIDGRDVGSFTVTTLKLSTASTFSSDIEKTRYPDVKKDQWYYDAVEYVSEKGFMTGYKNGNFGPSEMLQRQDFVVALARIAGVDLTVYKDATVTFADVDMNAYYGPAVAWAVENGIITGYNELEFGVGDKINREQVVTILYRFSGSPLVENADETLSVFPDAGNISEFAKNAMVWSVQNGVISGLQSGQIAPQSGASRAQIATIIMRMDQNGML